MRAKDVIRVHPAAALLLLAACQEAAEAPTKEAGPHKAVPAPANGSAVATARPAEVVEVAVPASYDWTFATHGGSGDLGFGDGDMAEGVSLATLSCLPGSNAITGSGIGAGEAMLRSGQISVAISTGVQMTPDHPVLRDLRETGTVTLVSGGEARVLAAKPGGGRIAIESFLAYCAAG